MAMCHVRIYLVSKLLNRFKQTYVQSFNLEYCLIYCVWTTLGYRTSGAVQCKSLNFSAEGGNKRKTLFH